MRDAARVGPGEVVHVLADVEHAELAALIADAAYRAGAQLCDVHYQDPRVSAARAQHGPTEMHEWSAPWLVERLRWLAHHGGVSIALTAGAAPAGGPLPLVRPRALQRAYGELLNEGRFRRVTAPAATTAWARLVYGAPDVDRLWRDLLACCRVAPAVPLDAHLTRLRRRADALNAAGWSAVRFVGPGTDLRVELSPVARWCPVETEDRHGRRCVGNVPTEEVMTVPNRRTANGVLRATAPVVAAGRALAGVELELADGRVVAADAGADTPTLRRLLDLDDGASHLGEVALVGADSPVAALGTIFYNTVVDENRAHHVALGQAPLDAVARDARRDARALDAAGVNRSSLHLDVCVGGPDVTVLGVRDGVEEPIVL